MLKCRAGQTRFLWGPWHVGRLAWSASFCCLGYFNKVTGADVIDVAVNRNMISDERMFTDTAYILRYARRLVLDGMPFYELACACSMTMLRI